MNVNISRIFKMNLCTIIKKVIGFEEIYTILYRKQQQGELPIYLNERYEFSRLSESNKYWYADPMLFEYKSNLYLFMEAYEYKHQRGCIACSMLTADGTFSIPQIILREHYHMSFPVVFEWNDTIYMMPETSENQSINLYRCLEFPQKWEKAVELRTSEKMVDTIILDKNDKELVILTSLSDGTNPLKTKFQLYAMTRKENKMVLSPYNDYNSAQSFAYDTRNAGNLSIHDEKILHPVQVSTEVDYGVSMNILQYQGIISNAINEMALGTIKIENVAVTGITSHKMIGVHTYSCKKGYEVVDLRYNKFRPQKWYYKLRKQFADKKRKK